jgi:hypothetical protein
MEFRVGRPFLAAAALLRGERRLESRRQTESPAPQNQALADYGGSCADASGLLLNLLE